MSTPKEDWEHRTSRDLDVTITDEDEVITLETVIEVTEADFRAARKEVPPR